MKALWNSFIEAIYPTRCVVCKEASGETICSSCCGRLSLIEEPICARCGKPTGADVNSCLDCRGRFKFTKARSLGLFEDGLKEAIYALKYKNRRPVAAYLARLALPLTQEFAPVDLITFVPLSRLKARKRGYNQAELIASELSKLAGLPTMGCMKRIKEEMDQVGLSQAQRRKNVSGVFLVTSSQVIQGKRVLLIDDVFTTGATADECASDLLKAGAARVDLLTMARVVKS